MLFIFLPCGADCQPNTHTHPAASNDTFTNTPDYYPQSSDHTPFVVVAVVAFVVVGVGVPLIVAVVLFRTRKDPTAVDAPVKTATDGNAVAATTEVALEVRGDGGTVPDGAKQAGAESDRFGLVDPYRFVLRAFFLSLLSRKGVCVRLCVGK